MTQEAADRARAEQTSSDLIMVVVRLIRERRSGEVFKHVLDTLRAAERRGYAAGQERMRHLAALVEDTNASLHTKDAIWMGPQRQRYEGARIPGVEMSPMNGPAIAHDGALSRAAAIRALPIEEIP